MLIIYFYSLEKDVFIVLPFTKLKIAYEHLVQQQFSRVVNVILLKAQ